MPKKWLMLGLKVLVSGGLIWFALNRVDFAEAMGRIRQADPLLLAAAVGVMGFQAFIGGWRWRSVSVAIGQPLRYWSALRFFYIGMFFNQARGVTRCAGILPTKLDSGSGGRSTESCWSVW